MDINTITLLADSYLTQVKCKWSQTIEPKNVHVNYGFPSFPSYIYKPNYIACGILRNAHNAIQLYTLEQKMAYLACWERSGLFTSVY